MAYRKARIKIPGIVLLTDFGTRDPFVGVLKGVLLRTGAPVPCVDLTHEVPPQDIRTAAFHLMTSYAFFPLGTLFIAIVDPGVGTPRHILYAETSKYRFLAPDNGLLSWALARETKVRVRRVENAGLGLKPVSATFHGRDIFAPAAGALTKGLSPAKLGPEAKSWEKIPFPSVWNAGEKIEGEVLVIDHFGNLITNLQPKDLDPEETWVFSVGNSGPMPWQPAYGSVAPGQPMAVSGSAGYIELSLRNGSAADQWNVQTSAKVLAQKKRTP
jgi:S-adenosylmethionine hydrolase